MEGTAKGPRMLWAFTLPMALTVSWGYKCWLCYMSVTATENYYLTPASVQSLGQKLCSSTFPRPVGCRSD